MLKSGLLAFLTALSMIPAFAFEAGRAREIVNIISSDEFEGRQPGHLGGEKIEYFLAEKLSSYGIHHGGDASYFQDVPLLVTEERKATLTLMDHPLGKIPFVLGVDYTLITHSGSGSVLAPVVFVGHGYVRPDKDRDDYADIDVAGKIVVILRGNPDSPYDFQEDFERRHTMQWAKEHGAAAILWYQGPRLVNGAAIPEASYDPKLPMMYVGDRVLNLLLDETGYTLKTYQDKIKNASLPLETGKRLFVSADVRKLRDQTAHNVLGLIHGTDPVLKNEIIVVGGHMDHIGVNANGVIYNGANDNGSGTAVVSELARSIAANPLKRSVLIGHFTGEELGLLGSEYFAEHPTVPIGNVVCMMNFDMSGHGGEHIVMGGGAALDKAWGDYVASLDSSTRKKVSFYREDGHGASDNLSFLKVGVPAIAFWSKGDHIYYHHYSDDPMWIKDSVLQAMGDRAENFLRFMGNRDGSLAYHADSLALMASFAEVLDFKGFTVDAQGTVPADLKMVSAAWVTPEPGVITAEIVRRASELQFVCRDREIAAGDIKTALEADHKLQKGIFLALSETALSTRRAAEVGMLLRQGIKVIQLSKSGDPHAKSAPLDVLDEARDGGAYALVPLDFNAPARVGRWKEQAIVLGSFQEFAESPASVRDGLLMSDAMLILEIMSIPTKEQLETIRAGRVRRVHLNFGTAPNASRLAEEKATFHALYAAGYSRNDILSLTGGNLRRFLDL